MQQPLPWVTASWTDMAGLDSAAMLCAWLALGMWHHWASSCTSSRRSAGGAAAPWLGSSVTRRRAKRFSWPRRVGAKLARVASAPGEMLGGQYAALEDLRREVATQGVMLAALSCAQSAPPSEVPPAGRGVAGAGEAILVTPSVAGVVHWAKGRIKGTQAGAPRTACG